MERYDADSNMRSSAGKAEYISAIRKKYGVDNPNQSKAVRRKFRETCITRYGVDHASKTRAVAKKISDALNSRTPEQKRDAVAKRKSTNLALHGDENFVNAEKTMTTVAAKYGVRCVFQRSSAREKAGISAKARSYEMLLRNERDVPRFSLDDYMRRVSDCDFLPFRCRKCGAEFLSRCHDGMHDLCPSCYPKDANSEERAFAEFAREACGGDAFENVRTVIRPRELDVYVPAKKWRSSSTGSTGTRTASSP
jgi:hypothetical protein